MKKFILFSLFATTSLLWFACQKESAGDVNQDKVYTEYEQFYNKNTDKTGVLARFRFGGATGTLLELDGTDEVKFNTDVLPYNALVGAHYKEYSGKIAPGTFTYTNLDGTVYSNTVPAFDTIAFQAGYDTLYKSSASTLNWVGNPLANQEYVGLFIGTWTWGQDALFFANGAGNTGIVMGTTQLSGLAEGNSTFYMDRSKTLTSINGTSEGGTVTGKYRGTNAQVTILP